MPGSQEQQNLNPLPTYIRAILVIGILLCLSGVVVIVIGAFSEHPGLPLLGAELFTLGFIVSGAGVLIAIFLLQGRAPPPRDWPQ